jgi:hypothetical protein
MTSRSYDVPQLLRAVVAAAALAAVVGGCGQPTGASSGDAPSHHVSPSHHLSPSHHVSSQPQSSDAALARAQLRRLTVRPRPRGTRGYDRGAFGSDWVDTDHDGCNQRDDVLLRDSVPGTTRVAEQGACDHDVLAGTWHDPYTGRTLRFTDLKDLSQAEAIQIDHVVPLAEAWVSGAADWSSTRREAFANDLPELLAVDGATNMSKGDGDPAAWRPRKGYQCTYARRWIAIKTTWHLAVDPSEVAALGEMLGYCR